MATNLSLQSSDHHQEHSTISGTFHNVSTCHLCTQLVNRDCPETRDVSISLELARLSLLELDTKVKGTEISLRESLRDLERKSEQLDQSLRDVKAEILSACAGLKGSVESCQHRLDDRITNVCDRKKTEIVNQKENVLQSLGKVTSIRLFIQRLKDAASDAAILEMLPMLKLCTNGFEMNSDLQMDDVIVTIRHYKFDPKIIHRLENEILDLEKNIFPEVQILDSESKSACINTQVNLCTNLTYFSLANSFTKTILSYVINTACHQIYL